MSRRHVSLVTKGKLADLARMGLSHRAIGRELGVAHATVDRWLGPKHDQKTHSRASDGPAITPAALAAAFAPMPALTPEQQPCEHWQSFTVERTGYRCNRCKVLLPEAPVAPRPIRTVEELPRRSWEREFSTGPVQIQQPSYGNIVGRRETASPAWTAFQHRALHSENGG